MRFLLGALLFTTLIASATANELCQVVLDEAWKAYPEGGVYTCQFCHLTIDMLVERLDLQDPSFIKAEARVLVIRNPVALNLHPEAGKTRGHVNSWPYHVVLEYRGMIYDLDRGTSLQPIPIRNYFSEMFRREYEQIQMRSVPAFEYTSRSINRYLHPEARDLEPYRRPEDLYASLAAERPARPFLVDKIASSDLPQRIERVRNELGLRRDELVVQGFDEFRLDTLYRTGNDGNGPAAIPYNSARAAEEFAPGRAVVIYKRSHLKKTPDFAFDYPAGQDPEAFRKDAIAAVFVCQP